MRRLVTVLGSVLIACTILASCAKNNNDDAVIGTWVSTNSGILVEMTMEAVSVDYIACRMTFDGMTFNGMTFDGMIFNGFCTRSETDGAFWVSTPIPNGRIVCEGTFRCNTKNTGILKIPGLESLLSADGLVLKRKKVK